MTDFLLPDGTYWEPDFEPTLPLPWTNSALPGELQSFDFELELELESRDVAHTRVAPEFEQFDFDLDYLALADASAPSRRVPEEQGFFSYDYELEEELDRQQGYHEVLFYDGPEDHAEKAAHRIGAALDAGWVALIIAAPEHTAALLAHLPEEQRHSAERTGRLVTATVEQTLASFMRDGMPDPVLFEKSLAAAIREHAQGEAPLLAYGEIAPTLWMQGNVIAALQVERLSNQLLREIPFSLLCSYQLTDDLEANAGFGEVCELHGAAHAR